MKTTEYTEQQCLKSPFLLPLLIAALWNITIGGVGLLSPEFSSSLLIAQLTSLTEMVTKQIFWLVVIVAGIGYGVVAFEHNKYRFFITIGGILKVSVFFLLACLWLNSTVTFIFLLLGIGDLIWAIYFFWFISKTRTHGYI